MPTYPSRSILSWMVLHPSFASQQFYKVSLLSTKARSFFFITQHSRRFSPLYHPVIRNSSVLYCTIEPKYLHFSCIFTYSDQYHRIILLSRVSYHIGSETQHNRCRYRRVINRYTNNNLRLLRFSIDF